MARRRQPLREMYQMLNTACFAGRLPPTMPTGVYGVNLGAVVVRRTGLRAFMLGLRGKRRGPAVSGSLGTFRPPGPFMPAQIRVVAHLSAEQERRVLLHEMAHLAVWAAGFHDEGHGPRFVGELERLARFGEGWAPEEAARYTSFSESEVGTT
ncbi:MAG: SprT-like domain-containing protein [Chloroflexota bacterium]